MEATRAGRVAVDQAIQALNDLPNRGGLHVAGSLLAKAIAALEKELRYGDEQSLLQLSRRGSNQ